MNKFTHLHVHSHYSLLQALPQIKELIEAAKSDGQEALALTDAGNMYGAIEFYKAAKAADIKPIIGVDFYLAPRSRFDKEYKIDNYTDRIVLLAKSEKGYKNLIKLVSRSFLEGFYYKPRIDKELIEEYKDELICILPHFSSPLSKAIKNNDADKAKEIYEYYKSLFADDLYIEITVHDELIGEKEFRQKLLDFSENASAKIVAAHDVYYIKPEDNFARELVIAIGAGRQLIGDEADRPDDFSFKTQKEMFEKFHNIPQAIENTQEIVEKCNLELELGKWTFPNFPKEKGKSYDEMLREKALAGFENRGVEKTQEALERMEYELDVIKIKGYSPYFLVVADLLNHARKSGIYTNTRGSAAGSFVSYLIGITNINPMDFNLPFERFLNPERPSAPDIDMDLADNRRDDMIEYARQKYGPEKVAQIGTFGTMQARAAVRDVARALGYSYSVGDRIAKLIPVGPQGFNMTIDKALEMEPELKEAYEKDPETREILDLAKKIEGNARHVGVHAAGVVIAPTEATDFVPLQLDPKGEGKTITQYDMHAVEEAGLLKYDFLGLKNLSILADTIKRVKKIRGIDIDIDKIPLDDERTYKMLSAGRTMGVFQLSSAGMTKWLMELKPTNIHDINAMVALYRPGPMEFIPDYIERKRDPSKVKYLDPRLKKILEPTFGILIYQDDVMMIAVELAGYTWGEADKFRKAMGKKIPEEMAAQEDKFKKGCIERGMDPKAVNELWDQIKTFAAYGFNKSHSASYGNLAYRTAYLKANYPLEYMSALLTADAGDTEKIAEIIEECEKMNIEILPPDINESFEDFAVVPNTNKIRFGLTSIKNFGEHIAHVIVEERKKNGPYKSLEDFLERVQDKNLNRRALESLIKAGALDLFESRSKMLHNIEKLLNYHKEISESKSSAQASLFDVLGEKQSGKLILEDTKPMSPIQKYKWEKELLGLYVSGHPLEAFDDLLAGKRDIRAIKKTARINSTVTFAAIIESVKTILTKNGDKMAFVEVSDKKDSIELVVFPETYKKYKDLLQEDKIIVAKGKFNKKDDTANILLEAIKELKR